MRVILEIDETTLKKIAEMAELEKRSRKNFMELILQTITEPIIDTRTFLTPNSTITNLSNGTTIENKTNKVQEVEPEMPSWKKKLLEYQSQQKTKK